MPHPAPPIHPGRAARARDRRLWLAAALLSQAVWFAATGASAQAAPPPATPPPTPPPAAQPAAATDSAGRPWVEAEVRRVDTERQRVSLRHGAIPNLEMAPMTMVFQVRDPALLQRLRQGERIRFSADRVDGEYTLMDIAPKESP